LFFRYLLPFLLPLLKSGFALINKPFLLRGHECVHLLG
jgi:hypothetical protein